MLRKITPDAKLLSDLSEEARTNTAVAKYTADDRGDIKFYQTGDGKRKFMRVCETIPPSREVDAKPGSAITGGPARYEFSFYEIFKPLGAEANPAPAILTVK